MFENIPQERLLTLKKSFEEGLVSLKVSRIIARYVFEMNLSGRQYVVNCNTRAEAIKLLTGYVKELSSLISS